MEQVITAKSGVWPGKSEQTTSLEYIAHLNKVHGAPREPTILSACFEPTNRCPGRCPYCLIEKHRKDTETGQLIQVLQELISHGVKRIGFGGGEPLLRSDIFELGSMVRREKAGALLRTSGMFKMDGSRVASSFDWIDLSFDSYDPKIFQICRPGVPYEVLVDNIQRLAGITRLRASILVTSVNVNTVSDTVRWLADTEVKVVRLQRLVRRGRAIKNWSNLAVTEVQFDHALSEALAAGEAFGIQVAELKSVSNSTLAIVKSDGSIFEGDPTGIRYRGSVYSKDNLYDLARRLRGPQEAVYLEYLSEA